ncbi:hypothetical protein AZ028_005138, partial [Klebsiella pneumoniae]
ISDQSTSTMGIVLPEQIKLACQRYTASRSLWR